MKNSLRFILIGALGVAPVFAQEADLIPTASLPGWAWGYQKMLIVGSQKGVDPGGILFAEPGGSVLMLQGRTHSNVAAWDIYTGKSYSIAQFKSDSPGAMGRGPTVPEPRLLVAAISREMSQQAYLRTDGRVFLRAGYQDAVEVYFPRFLKKMKAPESGALVFSSDGLRLGVVITGPQGERTVVAWIDTLNKKVHEFEEAPKPITQLAFSSDGRWLAGIGAESDIYLWDTQSRKTPPAVLGRSHQYVSLSFSPEGETLAGAGAQGVHVWGVSGKRLKEYVPQVAATGVGFSMDGRWLATVSEKGLHVYDREASEVSWLLEEGSGYGSVSFDEASTQLAWRSAPGIVRIWKRVTVPEFAETIFKEKYDLEQKHIARGFPLRRSLNKSDSDFMDTLSALQQKHPELYAPRGPEESEASHNERRVKVAALEEPARSKHAHEYKFFQGRFDQEWAHIWDKFNKDRGLPLFYDQASAPVRYSAEDAAFHVQIASSVVRAPATAEEAAGAGRSETDWILRLKLGYHDKTSVRLLPGSDVVDRRTGKRFPIEVRSP